LLWLLDSQFPLGLSFRPNCGNERLVAKGPGVASDLNGAAVIAFVINIISATVIGGSDIGSADVAPKTLKPEMERAILASKDRRPWWSQAVEPGDL
jgi:hypothetical protein